MQPFDDMLPEERAPQYKELTTLLQQSYRKPPSEALHRQEQILARVRDRLGITDAENAFNQEDVGGLFPAYLKPLPSVSHRTGWFSRLVIQIAAVLIIVLLLGSFLFLTQFRTSSTILSQPSHTRGVLSLQVTPSIVALGEMLTLRGSNFYPSGRVGLTRDANIPIVDTGGTSIIHADKTGSFSDTVWVDPSWGSGLHTIHAEDARMHKYASFPVTVTGQASMRPPHLVLSTERIDLGSGDQTTNSTQMIALSNDGGGQITWRATATESWLLISPTSGTISSDQSIHVTIVGDRSNLKVGSYNGSVIFTSNTGRSSIPVKMNVTPLQLTPAVFSFTGDGSKGVSYALPYGSSSSPRSTVDPVRRG